MELREIAAALGEPPRRVQGWGLSTSSESVVLQPRSADEVARVFRFARDNGVSVGLRGAGCSYGDASQNGGGVLLDLSRWNTIESLDADTGVVVAGPGVTLEQIWRRSVPLGWWPPVVSGTMFTTLGGLLAMNVHGKNNWQVGTIAGFVDSFRILTPMGDELTCSRSENADVFHAAIGGFGMLGCFTSVTLRLKRIWSGLLEVAAIATPDLKHTVCLFETQKDDWDYLVGWIDCFPGGRSLGRGLVHAARYLHEGEDPDPARTLNEAAQDLPSHILGVVPKSITWRFLRPFLNDPGMRAINALKYWSGVSGQTRGRPHRQAHAAFAFLLDYVPGWKQAYGKGGLIQYQTFLPRARASEVHGHLISLCQRAGLIPYLGVYKRHRPDEFWMTHAVDGFSFAMDFRVTEANRQRLWDLTHRMDDVVVEAGGRLYFAKDATMRPETARRIWPEATRARFAAMKRRLDPHGVLQTDLARRVLPELFAPAAAPAAVAGSQV